MKKPLVLAFFLWGALAGADPESPEQLWDAATRILRKHPIGSQGSSARRMNIEPAGRRNLFTVSFDKREKPVKGRPVAPSKIKNGKPGTGPAGDGVMENDAEAREYLASREKDLQAARKEFEQGRESRAADGLEAVVTRLEGVSFASDEHKAHRLKLLEQALSVLKRIEARREFRKKGCQVHFIIFNGTDRLRSVASIDGEIVREGGAFDGGISVQAIAKSRVTVAYKGETFDLSLVKAQ